MIRFVILALLLGAPASAQSRDAVFEDLWASVGGTVGRHNYALTGPSARSQIWTCETCGMGQSLRIGWYDWAYNYDTTDPAAVLRAISGACQFDPCTTQPYAAHGYQGLVQHGTHRRGPSARTFLMVGDRMWSSYAQGASSVEAALDRAIRAEATLLPRILAAAP